MGVIINPYIGIDFYGKEINFEMNQKEIHWGVMNSIHLAKDRNKWLVSGQSLGLLHFAYSARSCSAS